MCTVAAQGQLRDPTVGMPGVTSVMYYFFKMKLKTAECFDSNSANEIVEVTQSFAWSINLYRTKITTMHCCLFHSGRDYHERPRDNWTRPLAITAELDHGPCLSHRHAG